MTHPGRIMWFSFLLGWLIKAGVMRYGGVAIYQRLKPMAMGLIAGDATMVVGFLLVSSVLQLCGIQPQPGPSIWW
jgi:hypothetical protein